MNRLGLLVLLASHVSPSEIFGATGLESESASFWNRLGQVQKRLGPDTDHPNVPNHLDVSDKLKPVTCKRNGVLYSPSDEGFAKNCGYETKASTIIKTRDSMRNGAIFLKHIEAQNTSSCIITCCCTESCDLAVFKNKDEHSCYLFHCGQPSKCQFGHQEKYASLTFPTMQHSEKTFGTEEEQKLHEDELEGLHEEDTSDVKPVETAVIQTTRASTPPPTTTTTAERPAVSLYGFCYKGDKCVDSQAVCRESFCMCIDGYHAKFGQCRQLCQPHQFECDNGQDGPDCIDSGLTCDGTPQCADGSDEDSCKPEESDQMESQLPGSANKPHTIHQNVPAYDYYYQPVEYSNIQSEPNENLGNHKGDKDEPRPPAIEKETDNSDDLERVVEKSKNQLRDPLKNSSTLADVSFMNSEKIKEVSPGQEGMQQSAVPAQHKEESMAKQIHMKQIEEHTDGNHRNGYGDSSINDNTKSGTLNSSEVKTEHASKAMGNKAQYEKDGSLEGEAMYQGHHVAHGRISNNRGRYGGVNTEDGYAAAHGSDEAAKAHNGVRYPSNHNDAMNGRDGYHDEDANVMPAGNRHHGDTADAMDNRNRGSQGNNGNEMAAEGRLSGHHGIMKDGARYNSGGDKQRVNSKGQPSRIDDTNHIRKPAISSHNIAEGKGYYESGKGNKNDPVDEDRRPHMQESMNQNGRQQWPNWNRDEQSPKYQPPAGRDPSYDYSDFDRYYPDYPYSGQPKYPGSYHHRNQADRLGDDTAGLENEPDRSNDMKHPFDPSIESQDPDHQDSGERKDGGYMESNMNDGGTSNNDASDMESHEAGDGAVKTSSAKDNTDGQEADAARQNAHKEMSISPRATTSRPPLVKKGEKVEIKLNEFYTQKKIISPTSNAQGPIIALSLGLGITFFLLVIVGCRFRNMKRRLRRGRPVHSNEADYLINGMYL